MVKSQVKDGKIEKSTSGLQRKKTMMGNTSKLDDQFDNMNTRKRPGSIKQSRTIKVNNDDLM